MAGGFTTKDEFGQGDIDLLQADIQPATEDKQDTIISAINYKPHFGIDTGTGTTYYFGYKEIGGTNWRIKKMLLNGNVWEVSWASGASGGDTAWTNRTSQTYTTL